MPDARETQYLAMIEQFPESPLGYFSLGRYYLEQGRHAEAAVRFRRCTELQPEYAAALMSLGDALAGAKDLEGAKASYARARSAALAQNHPTLADEVDERVADLG